MGANVKPDELKLMAPDLTANLSDETANALIANAYQIALGDHFPRSKIIDGEKLPVRDMATKYMALHLISAQGKTGQGVISEKVDVLERHYADVTKLDWLNTSQWGQAYLRLYNMYGGRGARYQVIQH